MACEGVAQRVWHGRCGIGGVAWEGVRGQAGC